MIGKQFYWLTAFILQTHKYSAYIKRSVTTDKAIVKATLSNAKLTFSKSKKILLTLVCCDSTVRCNIAATA